MIQLALVGLGRFGSRYLETINTLPDVSLKYIVTPHPEEKEGYKGKFTFLKHYTELFRYTDIDGVIIATPSSTHAEIALACVKKGLNILVEKPMTTSLKDAESLLTAQRKHNGVVMVGHLYLYHPAFLKMSSMLHQVGKIRVILSAGGNWGPIRDDVSVLWDWSPHDVAMTLSLIKQMPQTVQAKGVSILHQMQKQKYDMIHLYLTFPENIEVQIENSWISPQKKRELTIIGTKGSIIFNDLTENKLVFYPGRGVSMYSTPRESSSNEVSIEYEHTMPLENQLREFIRCIKEKRQPVSDSMFGLQVIKILTLAERSSLSGGEKMRVADV